MVSCNAASVAKSMHQGTSNCGTATAVHFTRALLVGYCMMLLPPTHAPQLPHAFCRLRPLPTSLTQTITNFICSGPSGSTTLPIADKISGLETMQALQLLNGILKLLLYGTKKHNTCYLIRTQGGVQPCLMPYPRQFSIPAHIHPLRMRQK